MVTPHLRKRARFFAEYAGYIVGQRWAGALALAKAEARAQQLGITFRWEGDPEPYDPGDTDYRPEEVLGCVAVGPDGEVLTSLWGIADPNFGYQTVVEAELACEALAQLDAPPFDCPTCGQERFCKVA